MIVGKYDLEVEFFLDKYICSPLYDCDVTRRVILLVIRETLQEGMDKNLVFSQLLYVFGRIGEQLIHS